MINYFQNYDAINEDCGWNYMLYLKEAAYYNWLNSGCPDNSSDYFWYKAERQILGGTADECYQDFVKLYHEQFKRS